MTAQLKRHQKGFTLIELLVVIGILAVLLAITLIAINPARQFSQANDTKRRSDINAILNAVHQYSVDNNGTLPTGITATSAAIANTGADLCSALVPDYIAALPSDPQAANEGINILEANCALYDTEYFIYEDGNGRVTVEASGELEDPIVVTR